MSCRNCLPNVIQQFLIECKKEVGIIGSSWSQAQSMAQRMFPNIFNHNFLVYSLMSFFLFNIASDSPLTLHFIDSTKKLIKFRNKSITFILEFYIQRKKI